MVPTKYLKNPFSLYRLTYMAKAAIAIKTIPEMENHIICIDTLKISYPLFREYYTIIFQTQILFTIFPQKSCYPLNKKTKTEGKWVAISLPLRTKYIDFNRLCALVSLSYHNMTPSCFKYQANAHTA